MSSLISPQLSPLTSRLDFSQISPEIIRKEVKAEVNRIWPGEHLATLTKERIRHVAEELTPRLDHVEDELNKIGIAIKGVACSIFEIKNADKSFFDRVKSLETRIEKMLSPSEEYMKLQAQNKRDLIAIIVTVVSVSAIILAAIVAVTLL